MSTPYQEEEDSTFQQDGQKYSLNKLFTLVHSHPIANVSIENLDPIANSLDALKTGSLVCASCQNNAEIHHKRVEKADITIPLLITSHKSSLVVVDGLHRLEHAIRTQQPTLPAKYLSPADLEAARL